MLRTPGIFRRSMHPHPQQTVARPSTATHLYAQLASSSLRSSDRKGLGSPSLSFGPPLTRTCSEARRRKKHRVIATKSCNEADT